jgi:hypothetical protein
MPGTTVSTTRCSERGLPDAVIAPAPPQPADPVRDAPAARPAGSVRSAGVRVWRVLLAFWLGLAAGLLQAEEPGLHIRSAEIAATTDSNLVLDATFQIDLGDTLEDALQRGVTLHFVTEFELLFERWYFLNLWNKTISGFEQRYRLSFSALTRHYRLATGGLTLTFETLAEALAVMGRVRGQQIATRDQLEPAQVYTAQIRLRLDTAQLPKPFQISSIGSKTWNLSSDWYRWTVKP